MRKVVLFFFIGSLFASVIASIASAQQTAPTSTNPPGEIVSVPTPVDAPDLTLTRMEICSAVTDRKPVNIGTHFPSSQDKIYCFLEFGGAKKETTVDVVWTLGQLEMGRVTLPVRRFPLFRTWANKTIFGMRGDWKVEVLDDKGVLIRSAAFTVQ
jgi:hypothetical protein